MINKKSNRIFELRKLIHKYNHEYYVKNNSIISDFEFDELKKELFQLIKKYSFLKKIENLDGLTGATVLGDGNVALILDVQGLIKAATT